MANGRIWAIKGVSDRTRSAAVEAAHAEGLNLGGWLDQVLAKAADETRLPKPPAATREEVAELLDVRLKPIEELHRAGRSMNASSKELGVAYNAVRAHVRALETA